MGQSRNIPATLMLLPVILWEVYLIWFGGLVQSVKSSPSFLLYLALVGALYAGWSVLQLEYFTNLRSVSRKTQVWLTFSTNIWCLGLILLWLEPQLALPIFVVFFVVADLAGFLTARDLLHRSGR